MESERIVSLCYMSRQYGGVKVLCRIADFKNDGLERYTYNASYDFFATERDLIYGVPKNGTSAEETFGMYEWYAYQENDNWRTSVVESSVPWIEVVCTSQKTVQELIKKLCTGVKLDTADSRPHDRIFCCWEEGSNASGVYVPESALAARGETFALKEDVQSLAVGTLNLSQDVRSCRCRYYPYDKVRYLKHSNCWKPRGKEFVYTPDEMVDRILRTQSQRLYKDRFISRSERQNFASVLDKLSREGVTEEVAQQLGCSWEDAAGYVKHFLSSGKLRLERSEAEWIMQKLLENESEYVRELTASVEKRWKAEHTAETREAANELAELRFKSEAVQKGIEKANAEAQARKRQIQVEIEEANRALAEVNEKKSACEAQIAEVVQLREDVERQIQVRLATLREDKARTLVEEAWFAAPNGATTASVPHRAPACSVTYDACEQEIPEVGLDERLADATEVWTALCGSEQRGSGIASFLFAAYAVRQQLIVTGECAERIAELTAQLVTGRDCTKLYVRSGAEVEEIARTLGDVPHDCVCLTNGLDVDSGTLCALLRRFPETRFIITTPNAEALLMEPDSLFTMFFPVFSEEFCACEDVEEADRYSCIKDMNRQFPDLPRRRQLASYRAKQAAWFSEGFFAPLLMERCARLHWAIRSVSASFHDPDAHAERVMLSMLYAPLMKCLRRTDVLERQSEKFELLEEIERKRLLAFAGVEGARR